MASGRSSVRQFVLFENQVSCILVVWKRRASKTREVAWYDMQRREQQKS
jgi:hypothetical protein